MIARASSYRQTQPGYWQSENTHIPSDDIVSYVFGKINKYDQDKPIFVDARDTSQFVTAREAQNTILSLATGLKARGLQPGDCVCIHSYNNISYPLLWLGTIAADAIVTGSNPGYTPEELIHHLTNTDTKYVIAHVDCFSAVEEAVVACNIPSSNVFLFGPDARVLDNRRYSSWRVLLDDGLEQHETFSDRVDQDSTLAVYAATSGTTGLPKAAALSHRFVVTQAALMEKLFERRVKNETVTQLHCLPVFHAFASQIALLLPLRLGITTYILPRFKLDDYVEAIEANKITDTAVVPPIITALLRLPSSQHTKLQSLRYMICAGAPMNPLVQHSFSRVLHPSATIAQCWGATELGWITVFGQHEKDVSGSVGRLLPNVCLKIVDENGHVITREGVAGEARIRSSSMFAGYRGSAAVNQGTHDEEGYYGTGDRVCIRDGKIHIEGRIKDIMKVNGWQVSPEELQKVIMQLEPAGIRDCAVMGCLNTNSDGLQETLPRAYVVRDPSCRITEQDIKDHVAAKLVSYKRLSGGVVFTDSIPRNPTGKILRRVLEKLDVSEKRGVQQISIQGLSPADSLRYWIIIGVLVPLCCLLGPFGVMLIAALFRNPVMQSIH